MDNLKCVINGISIFWEEKLFCVTLKNNLIIDWSYAPRPEDCRADSLSENFMEQLPNMYVSLEFEMNFIGKILYYWTKVITRMHIPFI
jgi:hypothetical protein